MRKRRKSMHLRTCGNFNTAKKLRFAIANPQITNPLTDTMKRAAKSGLYRLLWQELLICQSIPAA
jgi:hypothetical protein